MFFILVGGSRDAIVKKNHWKIVGLLFINIYQEKVKVTPIRLHGGAVTTWSSSTNHITAPRRFNSAAYSTDITTNQGPALRSGR